MEFINENVKALLEQNKILEEEENRDTIPEFQQAMKQSLKRRSKNEIYESALKKAMEILFYEGIALTLEEILEEFSTPDNILSVDDNTDKFYPTFQSRYRLQYITDEQNAIPLPMDMPVPTRYDTRLEKSVPIEFRVTWMYRNEDFAKFCNEYYSKFNIEVSFENFKNKHRWKMIFKVKEPGYITRNNESLSETQNESAVESLCGSTTAQCGSQCEQSE